MFLHFPFRGDTALRVLSCIYISSDQSTRGHAMKRKAVEKKRTVHENQKKKEGKSLVTWTRSDQDEDNGHEEECGLDDGSD
nr:hypothetical protein CFP56_59608 [Quercus suber]